MTSRKSHMLITAAAAMGLYHYAASSPKTPNVNPFEERERAGFRPKPYNGGGGSKRSKRTSPKARAAHKRIKKSR